METSNIPDSLVPAVGWVQQLIYKIEDKLNIKLNIELTQDFGIRGDVYLPPGKALFSTSGVYGSDRSSIGCSAGPCAAKIK